MRAILLVALLAVAPARAAAPSQHERIEKKLDQVLQLLGGTTTKPPVAIVTPVPKPPSGIDYRPFIGMTPQFILTSPASPLQGRGLPAGWDWNAAFAAGVLNPDAMPKPPGPSIPPAPPAAQPGVLPWNGSSGEGAHVEVRTAARLAIVVPADFSGTRQLEVSNIAPGQPDRVRIALDGAPLSVPFAGGIIALPALTGGRSYVLEVSIEPAGFGVSLQLR